jgi:phosphoribosylanthranilate isomerase
VSVLVKICGLSDAQHVDAAVDAGADAVGFVFAKSVRQVSPQQAASISSGVPAHIRRVAVMLHPTDDEWQQVLSIFSPDVLQTDVEDFAALSVPDTVEQWPVYREGRGKVAATGCYVYEGLKSGQGETVDWSVAAVAARDGNMILAGGLAADNVAEAIATVRPYGVDVSSAVESAPGRKSVLLINEFVSAVRTAESNL